MFKNKKMKKIKTARTLALKDISKWMRDENIQIQDEHGDIWVVTSSRMNNSEQRKLNIAIGVNKVNYNGNTNGFVSSGKK